MYNFFALLNRMNHIKRWSLMRSNETESLMEHSAQTAILAQALANIKNIYFGGNVNVDKVATIALYHDTPEVGTGDLPNPVKYYNDKIKNSYDEIEASVQEKLLSMLPDELVPCYKEYMQPDVNSYEYMLTKVADKLSAYIKCIEEQNTGNHEFDFAYGRLKKKLEATDLPELKFFLDNFLESFGKPLDVLD